MGKKLSPRKLILSILTVILGGTACFVWYNALAGDGKVLHMESLHLPPGFSISLYARGLPGARSLAVSPSGTVYVGTIREGNVYAVKDADRDGKGETVTTLLKGLIAPNGVAFKDGSLYVAELFRVSRYDGVESPGGPKTPVVLNDSLPKETWHGWKYIAFGPDGFLYIPVGAPCNVCVKEDERFASLMRMKPDGSDLKVFARGIRNTVGFDWHPETKDLWFTDNGRDWLGDNLPPDEINCAPRPGMHFGFPYRYGANVPDPEFGSKGGSTDFTANALGLDPHVAALGMRFYTGQMFPAEYKNQIFVAEHGSWNRSLPIGYRLTLVRLDQGKPVKHEVFADGWLLPFSKWGRPVDLALLPDGSMLVSDDQAGVIYRITYKKP